MRDSVLKTLLLVASFIVLPAVSPALANWPPMVGNVLALQRGGSNLVDITYSLADPEGDAAAVSVTLSTDGGLTYSVQCVTVSGDVGAGVAPGFGRHIVWDAGADYPGYNGTDCRLRVVADDGGSLLSGFVFIPGGEFQMGSPTTESGHNDNETQHWVSVAPFYISEYTVTQAQYATLNPAYAVSYPDRPAVNITWYQAADYCNALSVADGLTPAYDASYNWNHGADGYRLPTESEWEFACRAGTTTPFSTASGICLDANTEANYDGRNPYSGCSSGPYLGHATDVGSYLPNPWGLYDMHGNVWEWCWDIYCSGYPAGTYDNPHVDDGTGGSNCSMNRVNRGGYYIRRAEYCRSATRGSGPPSYADLYGGFRLVRSAD